MADRPYLQRLAQELIDKGLLIEAGWVAMRLACVPLNAPQIQLDEMRTAFFAGAQHLFSSIMDALEPGSEPTPNDCRRLDCIDSELREFIVAFEAKHGLPPSEQPKGGRA